MNKFSGTEVGATAGGGIGSFLLPGVGTAIGSTVGGWIGSLIAPTPDTYGTWTESERNAWAKKLYDYAWTVPGRTPFDIIYENYKQVVKNPDKFMTMSGVVGGATSRSKIYGHDWKSVNPDKIVTVADTAKAEKNKKYLIGGGILLGIVILGLIVYLILK